MTPSEHARLQVELGERSYPILIGSGLLGRVDLSPWLSGSEVFIVSNDTVAPLYLDAVRAMLPDAVTARGVEVLLLPDGETHKHMGSLECILDALLARRFSRKVTLIALGGGVVGDITGFAAACYQRGVAFIQMPTTLLAQVDSSIGGKTAVNHPRGKNMIGAFHQPSCVVIDTDVLRTLPQRELAAGLAEVIKYGCIRSVDFFAAIERDMADLLALQPAALNVAIDTSCRIKADVVASDEREGGVRAILNFGHTFGHAIETFTGYSEWLHGEAVGAGMVMAADLSARLGMLPPGAAARIRALVAAAGLPVAPPPEMTDSDFETLMMGDKKVQDGRLRLVLLDGLGRAVVTDDFDTQALHATLTAGDALCGGGHE